MIDKVKAAEEERKKKRLQEMIAENEAKKAKVEAAVNARASVLASGVDENYLNTFIRDSKTFLTQSQTDWDNMSWQSATDKNKTEERNKTVADLNQRKRAVQAYLTLNKGSLSEDVFSELTSYLDSADYSGIANRFASKAKVYSQYKSEDDYQQAVKADKERNYLLHLDIGAYQKQIDDLRAEKNRYMMENKTNTNEKLHSVTVYDQSIADMEAYLLRAKRLQEKESLEGVYDASSKYYDPDFSAYAKQGASIYNPAMKDAEGWLIVGKNHIGGTDVGNIVTYSRDNWQNIAMNEVQGGHTVGSSLYHWMTEKEVSIYNYHLAKNGEETAQKYLDSIEETLNARKAGTMFESYEDKTALELTFSIAAGLDQFSTGVRNLFNNEDDYIPVSSTQFLSGMIREDLADTDLKWYNAKTGQWENQKVFGSSLGQALYDFGTTTSNMAPSILASTFIGLINPTAGAVTGNALLGASAAGNAYQEKLNLGYSKEEARAYSTLVGVSEATLQYLVGGVGKLGGKGLQTVVKNLDAVDNVFARFARSAGGRFLLNGTSEAIEEGLQSVIEPYLWQAVSGEEGSVDWQETMYSALMGFATGGLFEAGETAIGNAAANSQYRQDGRDIMGASGGIDAALELAYQMNNVADPQLKRDLTKQIDKVSRVKESGKTGSAAAKQVGKLYNITKSAANSQNKADIVKSLVRSGVSSNEANSIADALVAAANGQRLTVDQKKVLKSVQEDTGVEYANGVKYDNAVEYAVQHIINNEQSTVRQRNQQVGEFDTNIKVDKFVREAFTPKGKYAVSTKGEATKLEIEEDANGKTITKDTGETIEVKGVHEIRKVEVDGKPKFELILELSDGTTINAENVAFANKNDALIYEAIANLGDNIDKESANKLIDKYDGSDAMVFARAMAQAYTYGFYGMDRSEMVGKHSLATELTEEQRNYAYGLGEQYRPIKDQIDKTDAQKKIAESGKKPSEKGVYYRDKDGKATDISTYLKESGIKLNDAQKTGIEAMRKLSEMLGVRFNVFESWVENGTSYYLNEDGVKTKGSPNGFYDTATGEIYIDLHAGNNYEGTILFTVAHELTHFIRQWSPEHFTKIASIVFQHGGMKGNVSELIALKQKKAKDKGKPIDYDTAMEEVVADGMETILKDGKVVEFMAEVKQKDRVAWEKIKGWFKKLSEFLRKMVWAYRSHSAQTTEGAKVADFAENLLNQIEQIFAEGAVASGENYQVAIGNVKFSNQITMQEDVINSSNTGIAKETKTGIKMQERTEFEAQPKQVFRVSTKNGKAESKMLGTNKSVKELRDARFKENGFSKEEIRKINGFIKEMADNMAKYRLKYKFVGLQNIHDAKIILDPMSGKIVLSAMVNNSDYSVNFDFTKICKKRVALQEVLETLAREKGKIADGKVTEVNLSPANIKRINDILASYGVETACLCCFVESKRYNIQNYYQEKVVDVWNKLVDEVAPDAAYFNFADSDVDTSKIPDSEFADLEMQMKEWAGKTGKAKNVEQKMREFLADSPAARKKLRFSDLVTANGRTNLHKLYPEIESLILSKLGQSAPKSVEAFTPYNGEIDLLEATSNADIVEYLYSIAGVRSQSFSDFMIAHVFDVLQKTASMSARKMPAHVYTKEIARAMLFGMTGEKHNLSVLHNVDPNVDSWNAGLSKDGEYNFSDYEAYKKGYSEFVQSIGWKDAVKLQNTEGYSKDCGIIGVGFSYNHMLKLHNDPEVRQVIGYHTSQMPVEVKPLTHLDKAADYTDVQNTKSFVGFAKPNYAIPDGVPSYATPPQDVTYKGSKTTKVSDTFDIIGTFKKLSEGKTGDARTAAAKETLGQLLEYANNHGYVLRIAPGEAGKGDFNLYEDVQQTQNPYLTTDHYIEYCIERGLLPMFFEFSMNPNYYKDIFDFNVFDRKSYNPETGLHEDSEGRKAYAPQTAVHMLNEDGSLAFPENFFDIVDKQMSNYNSYMQDVDSKMPSIMDEVRAVTNSTSKLSDRDITEDPLYPDTERERSAFNRMFINKTNGLKRHMEKDIIITTDLYVYHVRAVGRSYKSKPFLGEILKKVSIDTISMDEVREEVINGTYRATEEDYIPYEETPYVRRRNDRRTPSLRERLAAEGYDYLLDEPYEGDTEADRGQGSGNRQSKVKLSDRDTDSVSNRSLLANAFESVAQNDIEKNKIQEYKSKIALIDAEEKKLRELNEQIKELSFAKGPRDKEKISKLRDEATKTANRINTYDKQLLRLETSKPLQDVLAREKKKAYKRAEQEGKKALADYKASVEAKQKETAEKWRESRKKAVESREKTAMRHKIRKVIRDLDNLLNRGNKKHNVKEDMKDFVASAIASAEVLFTENYSNEDMIRNGVGTPVTPEEQKYLDEARTILAEISNLPSGSYEAMLARQEMEGRLKSQFAYRVSKLKDVFLRERIRLNEAAVSEVFGNLAKEYLKLKNSEYDYVKGAYHENVYNYIMFLQEDIGGTKIRDMSLSQLESLYKAYTMAMTTVRNANKAFVASKNVDQLAKRLITEFGGRKMPKKKVEALARNVSNMTGWDYEKLYYALDRIGSDTLAELFTNLANAENIVMADAEEAKQEQIRIVEKYKYNTWVVDKKIDKDFVDNTGKVFHLTLGELMSLYAYSRRESAWDHIEHGGFVFGKVALTEIVEPAAAYKLTKDQCEAITNTLTDEQKAFVEEMQAFLSNVMGAKGNEVSMLLYGIEMFGEKNYFPIHISGQFMANAQESQAKEAAGFASMTNAGFTQAQNKKAKAPFVMEPFMDVWADHVNEMSRYHGAVPALEDIRKVMNYSYYFDANQDSMSVQAIMENNFGKRAVAYFNDLYKEANTGAITDKLQKNSHKLLSLFRKGSVAYSLSVLFQQPASIVRAYALVPKKYFRGIRGNGALAIGIAQAATSKWTKSYKDTYAKMLKYAPGVTLAKEIGGFDTASGHSIRSYLLDTKKGFKQKWTTGTVLGKAKAVYGLVDDNAIANLPNVADKIAWIEIWNACENEVKATRKDLTPNGEAFNEYVGKRFTEVIRATQVYDSIFAKSPMLKSKNLAVQYLVSFMSESNTVANLAESAVRDLTRGKVASGFRKATAVVRGIVFTCVLKSIIYAMRDDDEDETYIEKYTEALVNSLISDITVFNYIPGARDVWSLAQGYDVERPDMAIVSDAIASFIDVVKNSGKDTADMTEEELEEWDKKVTEANWKLADSVCALFGIPMKNVRREINAIMDTARIAHENSGKTSWLGIQNAVNQAIADASPSFAKPETQSKSDKLYDAIISGDTTYVSRLKSGYKDDKAYHSAVRKALRDNDLRIKEAAQAQINGDPSERVRIAKLIIADGFDQDDVVAAINAEINATTSYEGGSSTKEKGFYTTEDFALEIANGDQASAYAAKESVIATAQKNGKSKEDAEKSFASSAKSEMKKLYLSGDFSERKAVNALVSYCDMDETEAELLVESYGWEKQGYEGATSAAVRDYNTYCAAFAVPKGVYLHIRSFANNTENDKDANGKSINYSAMKKVIAEIDAQRGLSSAQKTAIARSLGWSDKNINKYKTW